MANLTINNLKIEVPDGTTILEAAQSAGIKIPTLCYLKDIQKIGACRVCSVEVEGARNLVASCVTPVSNGMVVKTNTHRVREARRTIVELILSAHEGDCQLCERGNDCELQKLAHDLDIRWIPFTGEKTQKVFDDSTAAIVRDSSKCILCRRCVTACNLTEGVGAIFPQNRGFNTIVGPAFNKPLSEVVCVQCGQCIAVCPVAAIIEHDHIDKVWQALDDPTKFVVVQTAPAIRASLGESFGYKPGTRVTGKMTAALRRLGFDAVFDTNFTADLTIVEEANEFLSRLKKKYVEKQEVPIPLFTSCCPAWVKYAEHFYHDFLPNISTCKSPQQMFGAAAKTYFAKKIAKHPHDIFVVSVMPCSAKKYEATRSEMNSSWVQDVDAVLTTRELARMIKQAGVDFINIADEEMDAPMGLSSGAADIFGNTGGVMEAAIRTAYEIITGRDIPFEKLHIKPIEGLEGIKEASLKIENTLNDWKFLEGVELKVAVAHGLSNAKKVLERIKSGEADYHFIEIMTCPGGCIGGAGQPRFATNELLEARIQALYTEDEMKTIRKSHENPQIKQLYKEFFVQPLSERSHMFLHTHYKERNEV